MHIWKQNLNEQGGQVVGSMLFHGRGSVSRRPYEGMTLGAEWLLFHKAGWRCGLSFEIGHGDGDDGVMLVIKIPWILALYLHMDGVHRFQEARSFDLSVFESRIRLQIWGREMDWRSDDPWWMRGVGWDLPWASEWVYTRILSFDQSRIVWQKTRRRRAKTSKFRAEGRAEAERENSAQYGYQYKLRNGETQARTATVHVDEMAWGYKWWPRPIHVRRSINVNFDAEVGEGTGSWKGGCTGCGYTLLPGESAEACLRRMERERKFER